MISPAGKTNVKYNCSQAYTVQAKAGYYLTDILVDGVSIGKNSNFTLAKVDSNHTISAIFTKRESASAGNTSAGTPGKLLYAEDFNTVKSVEALNWEPISSAFVPTAKLSIDQGKLIVDNMGSGGNTSYYVFLPSSVTDSMVKKNYTVQFDMAFLDATSRDNWFSILFNYNRKTSNQYSVLYFRMRGDYNAFQRRDGTGSAAFTNLDQGGTDYIYPNGESVTRKGIITKDSGYTTPEIVFNETSSGMFLKNKTLTVRAEVDVESEIARIFINDIYVTGTNGKMANGWDNFTASVGTELAFRSGAGSKVALDNIFVAEGLGIPQK